MIYLALGIETCVKCENVHIMVLCTKIFYMCVTHSLLEVFWKRSFENTYVVWDRLHSAIPNLLFYLFFIIFSMKGGA